MEDGDETTTTYEEEKSGGGGGGGCLKKREGLRQLKRPAVLCVVIFLLLGLLPAFDYHHFLPPQPDHVEMLCSQVKLHRDNAHFVAAHLVLPHGVLLPHGGEAPKVYLNATVLKRHIVCKYTHHVGAGERSFIYHEVYLSVGELESNVTERHERPFHLWNYAGVERLGGGNHSLDEHLLSTVPIDQYEDFWLVYLMLKCFLLILSLLLTLGLCAVRAFVWQRLNPTKRGYD
jgi:hypothetical protein